MKPPDPRTMLLIAACLSTMGVLIETTWNLACVFGFTLLLSIALRAKLWFLVKRIRGIFLHHCFCSAYGKYISYGRKAIPFAWLGLFINGGRRIARFKYAA